MRLFKRVVLPFVALLMVFTFMLPANQQATNRSNAAVVDRATISQDAYYGGVPSPIRELSVSRSVVRPDVPKAKPKVIVKKTYTHTVRHSSNPTRTLAWWHKVGYCMKMHESGGVYTRNTGNGYYGAYQFRDSTWQHVSHLPGHASSYPPAVQDKWFYYTLIHLIKSDTIRSQQWATWHMCV